MSDYSIQGVLHGSVPADKLSKVDLAVAEAMRFHSCEHEGELTFTIEDGWQDEVFAEDVATEAVETPEEFAKELGDLLGPVGWIGPERFLQHLCRKTGQPYLTVELAFTCSKMRNDGFGGAAYVVTPDLVVSQSTNEWIHTKLEALGLEPDARPSQTIPSPNDRPRRTIARSYAKLHDGLSDMIEGGRLSEADIPDDYRWLVESLAYLGNSPEDPADV